MTSRYSAVLALALFCGGAAQAQPYDVPYVPTPQVVVDEMLRTAGVGADDFVVDLGSGDGRILITAARNFGARGFGVDIDPQRIQESTANAQAAGVAERVSFANRDLFQTDISQATVVTMYLLPTVNLKLRPRLLAELKPGTRVVSHDFSMDDWKPDRLVTVQKNIYFWVVPAKVEGKWRVQVELPVGERSYEIEISQKFQEIDGLARAPSRNHPLWETSLRGDRIRFVIVDTDMGHHFEGRVAGDVIEGTVRSGVGKAETTRPFRAARVRAEQG